MTKIQIEPSALEALKVSVGDIQRWIMEDRFMARHVIQLIRSALSAKRIRSITRYALGTIERYSLGDFYHWLSKLTEAYKGVLDELSQDRADPVRLDNAIHVAFGEHVRWNMKAIDSGLWHAGEEWISRGSDNDRAIIDMMVELVPSALTYVEVGRYVWGASDEPVYKYLMREWLQYYKKNNIRESLLGKKVIDIDLGGEEV